VSPTGDPQFVKNGRRYLVAWATISSIAAVTSPDGFVELLQRRPPDGFGTAEPVRHPHGWAITRPGSTEMHYFRDAESLCGAIIGYTGLCYPHFDQGYFPEPMTLCETCSRELGASAA